MTTLSSSRDDATGPPRGIPHGTMNTPSHPLGSGCAVSPRLLPNARRSLRRPVPRSALRREPPRGNVHNGQSMEPMADLAQTFGDAINQMSPEPRERVKCSCQQPAFGSV